MIPLKQQQDAYVQQPVEQENNFKAFVEILDDCMIICSLQFSPKQVKDLKETFKELTTKYKEAWTDINMVCESVLSIAGKVDYLEGQSKCNNIPKPFYSKF